MKCEPWMGHGIVRPIFCGVLKLASTNEQVRLSLFT